MGPLGWPEMTFIFFLALLLFGPKKLPELGRTIGRGLAEFQRQKAEWSAALESETAKLKIDTAELTRLAGEYRAEFVAGDSLTHAVAPHGSNKETDWRA